MGSSASASISLLLNSASNSFYWAGDALSGDLVVAVSRPLTIKSIDVSVTGQVRITKTDGDSPVTITEKFYNEYYSILIPPTNGISFDEDGYHLQPNTYRWSFSIRLAKNLPPTIIYSANDIPYLQYFLRVQLKQSSVFHRDLHCKFPIMIMPRISPPRDVWTVEREEANFRDLRIYGRLPRDYFIVGEPYIPLELDIINPSQTTIKEIVVRLVQHRKLGKWKGRAIVFQESLPNIAYFRNNHLHQTFRVPLLSPMLLAPSSYYTSPVKPKFNCAIEYIMEVIFKTNLFFTNVTLEFPIRVINSKGPTRTIT